MTLEASGLELIEIFIGNTFWVPSNYKESQLHHIFPLPEKYLYLDFRSCHDILFIIFTVLNIIYIIMAITMSKLVEKIMTGAMEEKKEILSRKYVDREGLQEFRDSLQSSLVNIVAGPRRAGKSVFSMLGLDGADFAYLNFDDDRLRQVSNTDDIVEGIVSVYGGTKLIFFDEIQNLSGWELFVNKLHRRGYKLVITGSNSKLLSREMSGALTGRHCLREVFPFSFAEFLKTCSCDYKAGDAMSPEKKGALLNSLRTYMTFGGFPELSQEPVNAKSYLDALFESTLLKDVVTRYKVRFARQLYDLAVYLASNVASEYTFGSLRKNLLFNSTLTVQNYVGFLEETYLFFSLNRFSFKFKEQIRSPRKIYMVDNGYVTSCAFRISPDYGRLLENLVFIELLRRGARPNLELFYYRTRTGKEVDFLVRKGLRPDSLIQVCFLTDDSKTMKRELCSLADAGDELGCRNLSVITFDTEGDDKIDGKAIKLIPIWKWLLSR